eukprot:7805283-Alexandrium_andersonii.AAC.1
MVSSAVANDTPLLWSPSSPGKSVTVSHRWLSEMSSSCSSAQSKAALRLGVEVQDSERVEPRTR